MISNPIGDTDPDGGSKDSKERNQNASDSLDGPGPGEPVPEPGTLLLVGSGLAGAAFVGRRRRRTQIESE